MKKKKRPVKKDSAVVLISWKKRFEVRKWIMKRGEEEERRNKVYLLLFRGVLRGVKLGEEKGQEEDVIYFVVNFSISPKFTFLNVILYV